MQSVMWIISVKYLIVTQNPHQNTSCCCSGNQWQNLEICNLAWMPFPIWKQLSPNHAVLLWPLTTLPFSSKPVSLYSGQINLFYILSLPPSVWMKPTSESQEFLYTKLEPIINCCAVYDIAHISHWFSSCSSLFFPLPASLPLPLPLLPPPAPEFYRKPLVDCLFCHFLYCHV